VADFFSRSGSFDPLIFEFHAQGSGQVVLLAVVATEKFVKFAAQLIASGVPLIAAAEVEDGVLEADEAELLGTGGAEFLDFAADVGEEAEFEAFAHLARGLGEAEGDGRGERFEFIGDHATADLFEHEADFIEERREGEQLEGAAAFEVFLHAAGDFIEKGEVVLLRGLGGAVEGVKQPAGIVVVHLVAADLECGAVADEGDHSVRRGGKWLRRSWGGRTSVLEQTALHGVAGGAAFEGLDFPDEFADVLELAVNRDVADVGDGIDLVELVHDLGPDD